ncbi:WlaTC/HtrL family glycosyltransferase [Providencia hangzhouensis]|uniref:WlaTC/HtrL family glycosyltransferase n=1 Tax=Providencia hangzhouensis TaxID=3031799 RepID=UPI0034DD6D8C
MNNSITIITAFFDIGRGNWNRKNGRSNSLECTNNTYYKYFSRLAKLENTIVVFTTSDLQEKILSMRKGKTTHIITINLHKKFKFIIKKIERIQSSGTFKQLIDPKLLRFPEYWSPEYVLINNLKPYFVKKAIDLGLVDNALAAWVDFGYIRNNENIYGINEWYHPFSENKIHLFTIQDTSNLTDEQSILKTILSNDPHIIGGVLVASKEKWPEFCRIVFETQKKFLSSGIIDDDQGVFLTCVSKYPNIFQLNYLGYMKWRNVFKLFNNGSKYNRLMRLAISLKLIR